MHALMFPGKKQNQTNNRKTKFCSKNCFFVVNGVRDVMSLFYIARILNFYRLKFYTVSISFQHIFNVFINSEFGWKKKTIALHPK